MNKKIYIFLILSFISLQTFSFLHNAEFGFEEHDHHHEHEHENENEDEDEHDKGVCEIYLYCDQTKDNNFNSIKLLQLSEHFIFAFVLHKNLFFSQKISFRLQYMYKALYH